MYYLPFEIIFVDMNVDEKNSKPKIIQQVVEHDVLMNFATIQKWEKREDLIAWVRKEAAKLGFVVVIVNSDFGSDRRKQKLVLGCERGGVYKSKNKNLKREETGSRKCECPFRLRGYFLSCGQWSLSVVNGKHNHDFEPKLEGHLVVGRLTDEEKLIVSDLTKSMVEPRNIMTHLKQKNPDSVTTMKQVYNVRERLKKDIRGPRSEIQQLMKMLVGKKYFFKTRNEDGCDSISDIFWAHPESVKLFNTFPTVLLLDSTYKTNRYGMPLLEIVGVTSTDMTYSVGFAYLSSEIEDNFIWALEMCRSLLCSTDIFPKVIVTDRDNALMNVVAKVFPTSTALLCQYHIAKNVRSKCKLLCKVVEMDPKKKKEKQSELWDTVMRAWSCVVDSPTKEVYLENEGNFRKICEKFPKFLEYVDKSIFNSTVKEKIVRAWTNHVMHFGNTTTNRVESAHGRLKKYLKDSKGDFVKGWECMHNMMTLQFTEIQASFGRSLSVLEHRYNNKVLYSMLNFKISRAALNFIHCEEARIEKCGDNCGCVIRKTYGLPCACVIAKKLKIGTPIRLDEVNCHWKKLQFEVVGVVEEGNDVVSITAELKAIEVKF